MQRRDFLLLRTGRDNVVELSCERLYMRFVDAEAEGTTGQLFESLARELRSARTVRLTKTEWLAHERLNAEVERIVGVRLKPDTTTKSRTLRRVAFVPEQRHLHEEGNSERQSGALDHGIAEQDADGAQHACVGIQQRDRG